MTGSAVTAASVLADVVAEQDALDGIVAPLTAEQWQLQTPSPQWRVIEQIGHLTFFDRAAAMAIVDPVAFDAHAREFTAGAPADPGDDLTLTEAKSLPITELLARWREGRTELADAAATLTDQTRIEWYGPSMGSKSFLTARLMETWAHGQDIIDTIGVERSATDRLRHIAQLGYITRGWTYFNRGLEIPAGDVRVELQSPSNQTWSWGPEEADATVTGTALDFCLVTSQRRNLADTQLAIHGAIARDWLEKTQLFAGPPTDPPAPRL